ncbi:MAG: TonB family protein, partial [Myxococcota bacterium]
MHSLCRLLRLGVLVCLVASSPSLAMAQGGEGPSQQQVRITKAPKLVSSVEPDYPQQAVDARIEGDVVLKITIDSTGKVSEASILQSPGYGLGEAAKTAVLQYVFTPAEINDVPSPVILPFKVTFTLPILPASFAGKLTDKSSGAGLAGAKITVQYVGSEYDPAPEASGVTDASGAFLFQEVPPGPYSVTLELDAYRSYTTEIELVPGERSEAEYKIEAQPVNFTGEIRESGTRKRLPGVQVEVFDAQGALVRDTFTDDKGRFSLRGLASGAYVVRTDADGYLASAFDEQINTGERTEVSYFIKAQYYDEYSVSTSVDRERREVNRQTLTLDETRRIPGTGGDVVRV